MIDSGNYKQDELDYLQRRHEKERGQTSLRDYFAGKALQGLLSDNVCEGMSHCEVAANCYRMADAMLKAREVKP